MPARNSLLRLGAAKGHRSSSRSLDTISSLEALRHIEARIGLLRPAQQVLLQFGTLCLPGTRREVTLAREVLRDGQRPAPHLDLPRMTTALILRHR